MKSQTYDKVKRFISKEIHLELKITRMIAKYFKEWLSSMEKSTT